MTRDFGSEIDALHNQLADIKRLLEQAGVRRPNSNETQNQGQDAAMRSTMAGEGYEGSVYYSGLLQNDHSQSRWEPQERSLELLLSLSSEKSAKILAALGHKQRLDILKEVLSTPLTGLELVERLNMGTTGQLYHHLKALTGADLLSQEERGGRYVIPSNRVLPLMLLLAAVSDVIDTSDYMDMTHARTHAEQYLGGREQTGYDVHELLWAVIENCVLEHQAGYCNEVRVYVNEDGSITVADNGRGIPVRVLPQSKTPVVQSILTDLKNAGSGYTAPGAEKGISIAVVNALSKLLTVEIRREGQIFRQQYRNGIPQTGVNIVGASGETGTSVTFAPDTELFQSRVNIAQLKQRIDEMKADYPSLQFYLEAGSH